jgi:ELWxxDGT repeat protein
LGVEELEGRNLLSVSPIAFKTGGYYDSADVNGTFYFSTTAGELWKTDGTPGGTALVKDLAPGDSTGAGPFEMTNVNGTLFFFFHDPTNGRTSLWKSDGTEAGTVVLRDLNCPVEQWNITTYTCRWKGYGEATAVNGVFYYVDWNAAISQTELWKSDGTTAGTVEVKEFDSSGDNPVGLANMTSVNGTLFFVTRINELTSSLWKSDGTATGTMQIGNDLEWIGNLTDVNGTLFFTNNIVVHAISWRDEPNDKSLGYDLWKTDGTDTGTILIKHFNAILSPLTSVNGSVYFTDVNGHNDYGTDSELWRSDGTVAGTVALKYESWDGATNITDVNGTAFFMEPQEDGSSQLWKSDGSAAGTVFVKEFGLVPSAMNAPVAAQIDTLVNVNGTIYFLSHDWIPQGDRTWLWQSDGTSAGTTMIPASSTDPTFSLLCQLTAVNGKLFFIDLINPDSSHTQGLVVGKVDSGNVPTTSPVDLSTLDAKPISDRWPPYSAAPDSFAALLMPTPPSAASSSTKSEGGKAALSNMQISLAMTNLPVPVAYQSNGSFQSSESLQAQAQSSIPLTISLGFSNTSANTSNHFLISSPRGGFSVAEDEQTIADLDSFFGLEAKDPETVVVLGD